MVHLRGLLLLNGDYGKGTLFHPSYSFCVLRAYLLLSLMRTWQGLRICDGAPMISHLLFADDSMLDSFTSPEDCHRIRHLLNTYERASGQQVNLQKSNVVFSGSVLPHLRDNLAQILGVQVVSKHEKYLGIPTLVGRSKTETFAFIKDKLSKKLTGKRTKLLSSAGKEILMW
ncbi:uncharacterized protein LOC112170924 [Rosa chinensis]|uniref:uncharacterized protein LOC112170924 n=1 Tax=Rosa chinensis TaxID=74649 RepID=UPI000D095F8A|nr:uncharacterized protein LOC112170924 [Rosa chinensis]